MEADPQGSPQKSIDCGSFELGAIVAAYTFMANNYPRLRTTYMLDAHNLSNTMIDLNRTYQAADCKVVITLDSEAATRAHFALSLVEKKADEFTACIAHTALESIKNQ